MTSFHFFEKWLALNPPIQRGRSKYVGSAGKATKYRSPLRQSPSFATAQVYTGTFRYNLRMQNQHANGPELRGSNITLDKITSKTDVSNRRTKISKYIFFTCSRKHLKYESSCLLESHHLICPLDFYSLYSWTCLLGSRTA